MKAPIVATLDPDCVSEIVCMGKHNIAVGDGIATITFSHYRNEPVPLLDRGEMQPTNIVRARIVTSVNHLIDLRKSIDVVLSKLKLLATEAEGSG